MKVNELAAMKRIWNILAALPLSMRRRIVAWLVDKVENGDSYAIGDENPKQTHLEGVL